MKSNLLLAIVVGHDGNPDVGATNEELGITEHDLNIEQANAIGDECKKRDIPFIVIHRLNGLGQLPYDINKLNPTHIISVHHNGALNKDVNGTEVLYWWMSKSSKTFARCVFQKLLKCYNYKPRGLKPIKKKHNGWWILKKTSAPCILIEAFFTSNNKAVLNRKVKQSAAAIVDGFESYIGESK